MTGVVNQTGARSGIVGTNVGTPSSNAADIGAGVLPVGVTGGSGLTALGTVTAGNISNAAIVYPARMKDIGGQSVYFNDSTQGTLTLTGASETPSFSFPESITTSSVPLTEIRLELYATPTAFPTEFRGDEITPAIAVPCPH